MLNPAIYRDPAIYHGHLKRDFMNSEQAKCYKHVDYIQCEKAVESDFIEIREKYSDEKKCIFFGVDEPHYYAKGSRLSLQFGQFLELCKKHQIFNTDFYVPCFGDMFRDDFEIMNQNYYDWNFIPYQVDLPYYMGDAVTHMEKDIKNSDLNMKEIKYKFVHMNFAQRFHRQLFSKFLIKKDMVQGNCVAINRADDREFPMKDITQSTPIIPVIQNDDWPANNTLKKLWREIELSRKSNPDIDKKVASHYNFVEKAGVYIVSETVFHHPYPYLTEKTLSALLSKRPFIIIGASGSLRNLKSKGYKTFDSVIDESYDRITDPSHRLEAIFELVNDLHNKSIDQIKQIVSDSTDNVIHNRKLTLDRIRKYSKEQPIPEGVRQ